MSETVLTINIFTNDKKKRRKISSQLQDLESNYNGFFKVNIISESANAGDQYLQILNNIQSKFVMFADHNIIFDKAFFDGLEKSLTKETKSAYSLKLHNEKNDSSEKIFIEKSFKAPTLFSRYIFNTDFIKTIQFDKGEVDYFEERVVLELSKYNSIELLDCCPAN